MNAEEIPHSLRSGRRFLLLIGACLAVQLGLIFLAGSPHPAHQSRPRADFVVQFFPSTGTAGRIAQNLAASDPTVFVMPGRYGFSREAWLSVRDLDYEVMENKDSPIWLNPKEEDLGLVFKTAGGPTTNASLLLIEKQSAQPASRELLVVQEVVSTQSVLRITGNLQSRTVETPPALPSWVHSELLTNSAVEIAVDRAGEVVSVRLVQKSGLPEADRQALRVSSQLHFGSLAKAADKITWGRIDFQWHTRAASNAPTAVF